MKGIKITDIELSNFPQEYIKAQVKIQNYWNGPWVDSVDENGNRIGIAQKFFNKDPIEPYIEAMEAFIKKEHSQDYRVSNIYETHKPHSKYKYVAIIFKEKCKNTNAGPCY